MAIFRYEAADQSGKVMRGAMDAPSQQEVVQRLQERGYRHVRIAGEAQQATEEAATRAALRTAAQAGAFAPPTAPAPASPVVAGYAPRPEDLGVFFRQVSSLLNAGFAPSTAMADLATRTTHRGLSRAAAEMAQATANGGSLAGAMARFPTVFAPHIVGLVSAGETGGFLPYSFEEAALGAEQDAALKQGMWLPKFLTWQSVWAVLLFQPLFPNLNPAAFESGLSGLAASFAPYQRAVLFISVPIGIALHLLAALVGWMRPQPFARGFFDGLSLRLPIMRRLAHMRGLAAFTRVLRRLLAAGISVEPAFVGAVNSVPNAVLRERLRAGLPLVRQGQGIDAALQSTGMMDHDPLQLLVTGQKTGQWTEMLDRVTTYYQEEAARATEAARRAQSQAGVLITLVSSGYVLIVATHGMMSMGMKIFDAWTKD